MRNNIRFKTSLMVGLLSLHALSSCSSARQQLGMSASDNLSCLSYGSQQSSIYNDNDNRAYESDGDRSDSLSSEEARSEDDETADDIYQEYGVKPSKGSWRGRWKNLSLSTKCGIIGVSSLFCGGVGLAGVVGGGVLGCAVSAGLSKLEICKAVGFGPSNPPTTTPNPSTFSNISVTTEQLLSSNPDDPFPCPKGSTTVEPDPLINELDDITLNLLSQGNFKLPIVKDLIENKKLNVNARITTYDDPYFEPFTPLLCYCLERSEVDVWDYLITKKVNLDLRNLVGRTALMYTGDKHKEPQFVWLLENGANPFIEDHGGHTAKYHIKNSEAYSEGDKRVRDRLLKILEGYEKKWERENGSSNFV